jgi:2-methylcitrate dehydratase PrpD
VITRGKIHILDALGLALAGSIAPPAQMTRDHVLSVCSANGDASILGTGHRVPARFAALCNGTSIHADNFDDTNPQADPARNGGIHATGAVLATALALSESLKTDGRNFMAACHVGVEIACKLSHAIDQRHYADGFHTTGTLNAFGCAAAAGRMMGLDTDGITHALAFAASEASGVRRNFGSMVEVLHSGHAAECGVVAADFAARGLTGAVDALEGVSGYIQASGGGYDETIIDGRLGAPWAFSDPGMWIKPHPSGALTHPALAATGDLLRDHDVTPDQVAAIRVRTNDRIRNILTRERPVTGLQAKFSMEFSVAILVLEGRAGLSEFTDQMVARPEIAAMMDRIDYDSYSQPGPDFTPDFTNVTTLVEIDLSDGQKLSGRADYARGSTNAPMSFDDVTEKFRGCASHADWPDHKADQIIELVRNLESQPDLNGLVGALTG